MLLQLKKTHYDDLNQGDGARILGNKKVNLLKYEKCVKSGESMNKICLSN